MFHVEHLRTDFISNALQLRGHMSDITKCPGTICLQKESCYRFKAIPHEYRQSWCDFSIENKNECLYFQPINGWPILDSGIVTDINTQK